MLTDFELGTATGGGSAGRKGGAAPAAGIEWYPEVGGIYRDLADRSLLVLTVHWNNILIERGSGELEVIDLFRWRDLQPVPASC